jgi:hypothetical protein
MGYAAQFRVNFCFNTTGASDHIRVLTALPALGVLAFSMLGLAAAMRRRW